MGAAGDGGCGPAHESGAVVVCPYMGLGDRGNRNSDWGWRLVRASAVGVALSGGMALGQAATTLVMPQGPLLPARFGAWTVTGAVAGAGGGAEAENRAGAERGAGSPMVEGRLAEVLKEDGLTRSLEQSYAHAGRAGTIKVDGFQFGDATGAESAFTYLRSPEMKVPPPGARIGRDEAVLGGRYLIRDGASVLLAEVSSPGPSTVDDLRSLAVTLPKVSGPRGASPLLPTYLPTEGLKPASVRYAVGPVGYAAMGGTLPAGILGLDKGAEAVTAEYAGRGGKGLLTLLLFPTPQIAGDRGRAVEAALNAAGERAGTAKLRREGPMVLLATGGFSAEEAKELVDKIHLRTEVTWNKAVPPVFQTEVRKTASLLVSIAVLSGVLGLAAVLLGLFLGLGRAWIRVLMGKPAAMEPEFLRLDLARGPGERARSEKAAGA